MTDAEIKSTLSMLKGAIDNVRVRGQNVDSIRMGYELSNAIVAYNIGLLLFYPQNPGVMRTIYGYPVEIDKMNPWVLKVMTAVEVPVFRESEVSGNEYDGTEHD